MKNPYSSILSDFLTKSKKRRVIKRTLQKKSKKDYTEIVMIGDIHWGSPQCDKERVVKMLSYCYMHNIYVFLMGDLIEMSTRDSIGAGIYEQEFIGQEQMEQVIKLLKPLADNGLIIGMLNGNHEERVYRLTGVDISKFISSNLDIPYLGDAGWLVLKVGKHSYSIYALHGRSNARYEGTVLTALERLSASFDADIVAMGHTHKLITSHLIIQFALENGKIIEKKKYLVCTGSYLKYDMSYAQARGMNISKLGSPKIKLFSEKKDIHIST